MKFSFLIACIASALSLGAAEFDPGGTAFDFAEISAVGSSPGRQACQ